MKVAGVDEAGRGPVIGPLVICGVLADEKGIQKLENIGVKDSKLLTPLQRERMFERIKEAAPDHVIMLVSPEEIDAAVLSKTTNLNWLEADSTIHILKKMCAKKAVVDCPSTNIAAYKSYLQKNLPGVELLVEHKADTNHIIVGAASILAKVTRDREIGKIQHQFKERMGSGYPSDPVTQEFLKKHWKTNPEIFRKSWESYTRLANVKKQKTLEGF